MACQHTKRTQSRPGAIIICMCICVCLYVCVRHINDGHLDMNCTKPIHSIQTGVDSSGGSDSLYRIKSSAPLVILIPAESLSRKIAIGSV